ncbi:TetR/AcrR family transcriptional regulator [Actinoplanes regularis]|uniref:TetR/AcrR family transcriptional regulator n=1 Tax=Actinoplanes regularis TaxID=52697 RepID=UPI001A3F0EB7|nr:TetR/AcrR family transcriptional regulator [Actinoplanes regularis]GIE89623.1 TetR family transcriptional regulator [Actinoplanes regularis]GLW34534.1 TetR family transcriptional regulator [Actinoplanes regularis]
MTGLRERKKQETRQRLADLATAMFIERGFDNVSVAEVAEAAGVSKVTVFNYFPRKEDLFFDRTPEFAELLTSAVRSRDAETTPLAAIRELVLGLFDARHPMAGFAEAAPLFWNVVLNSPALRARAREAVEELEALMATLFTEAYGAPAARLTAALTVAAWRTAYLTGVRRVMAGERTDDFLAEQRAWTVECFAAVPEPAIAGRLPGPAPHRPGQRP